MEVRAKKSLGQHFLTDQSIARAIVDALSAGGTAPQDRGRPWSREREGPAPSGVGGMSEAKSCGAVPPAASVRDVLEIGPGMGVLTQYLLQREDIDLKLVELDGESVDYLLTHFPGMQGRLYLADYLRLDIHKLFPGPYRIIGNFPYNISSQIFFKILDDKDRVPEVVCMIQKEVAERIAESPGSKTYGILSVLLQAWYDIDYVMTVGSGAFSPPPKVQSAVIRLRRNARTTLGCDEKLFKTVVKTAFNQRRKTLRNALKPLLPEGFDTSGPVFDLRAERLGVEDFVTLTQLITP
ncbi:MAG: 16S rRNA (adenine(1518)-N(6)/adenine(1519)-N(6))-dimethyltransferase RsmA [Bacteroidales bacterium]|nr:16S rRNA (adenine(1518)-N(6)/adenine(1519)-N(6))-dimethyltransferase RsmA [Bacteroidales bacterium]